MQRDAMATPVEVSAPARILIVDDDADIRRLVARRLRPFNALVTEAGHGMEALAALDQQRFDVIVSDVAMPHMTGTDLLRAIRTRDLDVPVVFLSGAPSVESAMAAIELGALEYLTKPIDMTRLESVITRAIRLGKLGRARRNLVGTGEDARSVGDRAALETVFARTLPQLWLALQPVANARGEVFGYEGLMRSPDPQLGTPLAVLDAAEKLGRLSEIGQRMRSLAAAAAEADPGGTTFFVNLHPRDLADATLLADDAPLLRIANRVILEITERASLEGVPDLRKTVEELRERGFRLAIDDLGAGYAGLSAFALLEPHVAKLDMSLVRDIDKSTTKQRLVASMASVCRDLGIICVAEGIETVAELETLHEMGCDLFQGYLLARPAPPYPTLTWPALRAHAVQ